MFYRASGGEVFKLIAVDPLQENQAREVVWQLLEGVSHLHSLNVVHLDLKVSENCFIMVDINASRCHSLYPSTCTYRTTFAMQTAVCRNC